MTAPITDATELGTIKFKDTVEDASSLLANITSIIKVDLLCLKVKESEPRAISDLLVITMKGTFTFS